MERTQAGSGNSRTGLLVELKFVCFVFGIVGRPPASVA